MCHSAVAPLLVSHGDVLFREGEVPSVPKMLFVVGGQLEAASSMGRRKCDIIRAGQWLCEAVLYVHWVHRQTVVAQTFSKMLTLDSARFGAVVSNFPTLHAQSYATEFARQLNDKYIIDGFCGDVGQEDFDLQHRIHFAFAKDSSQDDCRVDKRGSLASRQSAKSDRSEQRHTWRGMNATVKSGKFLNRLVGTFQSSSNALSLMTRGCKATSTVVCFDTPSARCDS